MEVAILALAFFFAPIIAWMVFLNILTSQAGCLDENGEEIKKVLCHLHGDSKNCPDLNWPGRCRLYNVSNPNYHPELFWIFLAIAIVVTILCWLCPVIMLILSI